MENKNMLDNFIPVYKILNKLLIHPKSDWKARIYVNCALAYFIHPHDVIPESKHRLEGYVDDFYICLRVLKDLKKYRTDLILETVSEYIKEDLDVFISGNIKFCKSILGDKTQQVEKIAGYDTLNEFDIQSELDKKSVSSLEERVKMLATVAFIHNKLMKEDNISYKRTIYKSFKEVEYFLDVQRICKKFNEPPGFSTTVDKIHNIEDIFFNYEEKISRTATLYIDHKEIVELASPIFKTLCNILNDRGCDVFTRHEVNCALSYFGLIDDAIPDDIKSGVGVIDDVFLGAFVLFDIYERNAPLVRNNCTDGLDFRKLSHVFEISYNVVESCVADIINLLGLKSLLIYYDMHILKDREASLTQTNNKIKADLINLLNLYFQHIGRFKRSWRFSEIRDKLHVCLPRDQRVELDRFIEISKEVIYNKSTVREMKEREKNEIEMQMLRHKILSDINE